MAYGLYYNIFLFYIAVGLGKRWIQAALTSFEFT